MEEGKIPTGEEEKRFIEIEESPGLDPGSLSDYHLETWWNSYSRLSNDKKMLFETQEQTRQIRRISNNVLFFFWLTFISMAIYLIVLLLAAS
jgi:hypothetical protein